MPSSMRTDYIEIILLLLQTEQYSLVSLKRQEEEEAPTQTSYMPSKG